MRVHFFALFAFLACTPCLLIRCFSVLMVVNIHRIEGNVNYYFRFFRDYPAGAGYVSGERPLMGMGRWRVAEV